MRRERGRGKRERERDEFLKWGRVLLGWWPWGLEWVWVMCLTAPLASYASHHWPVNLHHNHALGGYGFGTSSYSPAPTKTGSVYQT